MSLTFEDRPSDVPGVARIWRSQSEYDGAFTSIAAIHPAIVVTKYQGKMKVTVRGPETKATQMGDYPAEMEWVGIDFKPGTFMPHLPPARLMDLQDVNLPEASDKSFWLHGAAWEFPDYDNADVFVQRMIREGLLVRDTVVEEVLQNRPQTLLPRSIQYHFLRATGLTNQMIQQIERVRIATARLKQGMPILDVVHDLGYFDQPHLTRILKRFVGHTPAQVIDAQIVELGSMEPIAFSYKTAAFGLNYDVRMDR